MKRKRCGVCGKRLSNYHRIHINSQAVVIRCNEHFHAPLPKRFQLRLPPWLKANDDITVGVLTDAAW